MIGSEGNLTDANGRRAKVSYRSMFKVRKKTTREQIVMDESTLNKFY